MIMKFWKFLNKEIPSDFITWSISVRKSHIRNERKKAQRTCQLEQRVLDCKDCKDFELCR
jgi:hypothetical protein